MLTWHIYDMRTGLFTGRTYSSSDEASLSLNLGENEAAVTGVIDYTSQRVDLSSGEVVDYQPPPPEPRSDYEWIHDDEHGNRVRRWVLKRDLSERISRMEAARSRIAELESKQERAIREHVLGIVPTDEDRAAGAMTLEEIQEEITVQRAIIQENS